MIYDLGDRTPVFEGDGHFIADNATIIGSVRLGANASVWFNCVLRGDNDWLVVGERSNIQDGSVLHTDPGLELVVGSGVTVGHKVMLHGCTIGDGTLIGMGATVMNGAVIGRRALIGAGGLGDFIFRGISTGNNASILLGVIAASAMALLLGGVIGGIEKVLKRRLHLS